MRYATQLLAGLGLGACDMLPGQQAAAPAPAVAPERVEAFVTLVEVAGCELPHTDNDHLLDPAGFGDAEASAISRQLIAEGRAEVSPEGNLVLMTERCV
jgi:hypothetical protein